MKSDLQKRFHIFWFGDNGPNWVGAVDTLETAQSQIETLPMKGAGGYGVLDQRTGNRLSFAPRVKSLAAKAK
jgi:hypothetical protein